MFQLKKNWDPEIFFNWNELEKNVRIPSTDSAHFNILCILNNKFILQNRSTQNYFLKKNLLVLFVSGTYSISNHIKMIPFYWYKTFKNIFKILNVHIMNSTRNIYIIRSRSTRTTWKPLTHLPEENGCLIQMPNVIRDPRDRVSTREKSRLTSQRTRSFLPSWTSGPA